MTAKQKRRRALLSWRYDQYAEIGAVDLAESLSCENLKDFETPYHLRKAVTEFRHLRSDARVSACRTFMKGR